MTAATVAASLRIVGDFPEDEKERLREILSTKLDRRLSRWDDGQVELELSVKDRDTDQQRITLQAWIAVPGQSDFVATSTLGDVPAAVADAGDDLHRQINRFVTRREDERR